MDKKKNNEELQSRREFMKKTAKGALPILGISLFGPAILSSCEKEEVKSNGNGNGNGSCSCSNTCSGSCDGDCAGNCDGCSGSCYTSSCKYM